MVISGSFVLKIPVDPLYCPNLTCIVYDFLIPGKSQPVLGTFTLNLHDVYSKEIASMEFIKKTLPVLGKKLSQLCSDIYWIFVHFG